MRRIAFLETSEVFLLLLPRSGRRTFRLPVPGDEYGRVQKLLQEKARDGDLDLDPAILGL